MSESKEPMLFINWQEVRKRWSRFGFALVAGLFYLAILALLFEAVHIVLYAANLPASGGRWESHPPGQPGGFRDSGSLVPDARSKTMARSRVVRTARVVRAVDDVIHHLPVQRTGSGDTSENGARDSQWGNNSARD